MKKIHLLYNSLIKEYCLSFANDPYSDKRRIRFFEDELLDSLKSFIDFKRNSSVVLYDLPKMSEEKVRSLFKNSKVSIEKKLNNKS
jgi:hypothetical protein